MVVRLNRSGTDHSTSELPAQLDTVSPTGAVPPYGAVIFDMDGVVADASALHAAAWADLFEAVLGDPRAGPTPEAPPFDVDTDYRSFVAGRSRENGVVTFLATRGVEVPTGEPGDPADAWTVHG